MNKNLISLQQNMALKAFSPNTQKTYLSKVKFFLQYCDKNDKEINSATFKTYLLKLIEMKKTSTSTIKQYIGAIRFFLSIR